MLRKVRVKLPKENCILVAFHMNGEEYMDMWGVKSFEDREYTDRLFDQFKRSMLNTIRKKKC